MLNKDKRSILLCFLLGDGSISYLRRSSGIYGCFTIDHGISQSDYQSWKAQIISHVINRDVRLRTGHKGKSVQISFSMKRLRAWKKFCYTNGRKDLPKILNLIRHPELALMVMLMDDGYVEPSFSKLADGSKKNYGGKFRLFLCDQTNDQLEKIVEWGKKYFDINFKIAKQWDSRQEKYYPFLRLGQEDSLKIWLIIRNQVLKFKSMRYKFRYIEDIYQTRIIQRNPTNK